MIKGPWGRILPNIGQGLEELGRFLAQQKLAQEARARQEAEQQENRAFQQGLAAQNRATLMQQQAAQLLADPDTPDALRREAEALMSQLGGIITGSPLQATQAMQGLRVPVSSTRTVAAPGLQRQATPPGVPSFFGATGARPTQQVTETEQVNPVAFLARVAQGEATAQATREKTEAAQELSVALASEYSANLQSPNVPIEVKRSIAKSIQNFNLPPGYEFLGDFAAAMLEGAEGAEQLSAEDIAALPADIRAQNLASFVQNGTFVEDMPDAYREYIENNPGAMEQVAVYKDKRAADSLGLESAELGIDIQTATLEQTQQAIEQQGFENQASRTDYVFQTGNKGLYEQLSPQEQRTVDARLKAAGVTLEDRAKAYYDTLKAEETLKQQAVELGQIKLETGRKNNTLLDYQIGAAEYAKQRRPIETYFQDLASVDEMVGTALANGDTERVQRMLNALESGGATDPQLYEVLTNAGYTAEELVDAYNKASSNEAYQRLERQLNQEKLQANLDLLPLATASEQATLRGQTVENLASIYTPEEIQAYWDNNLSTVEREALGEPALLAAKNRAAVRVTLEERELNAPAIETATGLLDFYARQRPEDTEQGLNALYGALGTLADNGLIKREDIDGIANFYLQAWGDQESAFNMDMAAAAADLAYSKMRTAQVTTPDGEGGLNLDVIKERRYQIDQSINAISEQADLMGCGSDFPQNPNACAAFGAEIEALRGEYRSLGSLLGFGADNPEGDAPSLPSLESNRSQWQEIFNTEYRKSPNDASAVVASLMLGAGYSEADAMSFIESLERPQAPTNPLTGVGNFVAPFGVRGRSGNTVAEDQAQARDAWANLAQRLGFTREGE